MATLIYSAIASLDGYVADEDASFDWAVPDAEVHAFINNLERPVGTYRYGRRMYEVMVGWEIAHTLADQPPFMQDFAEVWQAADKIVYSKTLEMVSTARTRIGRDFAPEAVRQVKASAGRDIPWAVPTSPAIAIRSRIAILTSCRPPFGAEWRLRWRRPEGTLAWRSADRMLGE